MTLFDPCRGIVRILHPDGSVEGVGFLISERRVLTCAHVYESVAQNQMATVDFPLLDRSRPIQARLTTLCPALAAPIPGEVSDIAVLEIPSETVLPADAAPLPCIFENEASLADRWAEIYGFPHDMARDHWVKVRMRRRGSDGRIQLDPESDKRTVVQGYSGAPVWDGGKGVAVGMIVEVNYGPQGRVVAAYMIPSQTLANIWPPVDDSQNEPPKPQPHANPKPLVRPGGALKVDSQFYIQRQADQQARDELRQERGLVALCGPRQVGKTSLLLNLYAEYKQSDPAIRPVFIDFQSFESSECDSLGALWREIVEEIAWQLELDAWKPERWSPVTGYRRNISVFMKRCVFRNAWQPLLICLDEVDRVLNTPFGRDFFASIRAFFNKGAIPSVWSNVRWLISSSTEPRFFIKDLNQSPFNVGLQLKLNAFRKKEVAEFAHRHGLRLDDDHLNRIMQYLGGRPYLVHLLFYQMASFPEIDPEVYFDARSAGNGLFQGYLERYLEHFQREPELGRAMLNVIRGRKCHKLEAARRLESAGLIMRSNDDAFVGASDLYIAYFKRRLE